MTTMRSASRSFLLVCVCAVAGPVAAAESLRERPVNAMPKSFRYVLGLEDGSAVVLGTASTELIQVLADGSVAPVEHPPAGRLLHLASRDSQLWVLGTEALLRRAANGVWSTVPFSVRQLELDLRRRFAWQGAEVVPLQDGKVVLFRTLKGSKAEAVGHVLVLNRELRVEVERTFTSVLFRSGVTDASGALCGVRLP